MIETIIPLKSDINYEVEGKLYRIICPDGFAADIRRTLSNGCIEMQLWAHLGADVQELIETKSKKTITLPGVRVYKKNYDGNPNCIAYQSDNKEAALMIWNKADGLKKFLVSNGIKYGKPECIPYYPRDPLKSCPDHGILDSKYHVSELKQ